MSHSLSNLTRFVSFTGRLDVELLRRLGPALSSPQTALLVNETESGHLEIVGLASTGPDADEGPDTILTEHNDYPGFMVEIIGPGELRAYEINGFRLSRGIVYEEANRSANEWFTEWVTEAGESVMPRHPRRLGTYLVASAWCYVLRRVMRRRHGGCFVVLDNDEDAKAHLRVAFPVTGCSLIQQLKTLHDTTADLYADEKYTDSEVKELLEIGIGQKLHEYRQLSTTLDAIVQFAATDGCVVFDKYLNLKSFGSMIEIDAASEVSVFLVDRHYSIAG